MENNINQTIIDQAYESAQLKQELENAFVQISRDQKRSSAFMARNNSRQNVQIKGVNTATDLFSQ